jgi:hypothetical protein
MARQVQVQDSSSAAEGRGDAKRARVRKEIQHPRRPPLRQGAPVLAVVEEQAGRVPIVEAHFEARRVLPDHE